MSGTPESPRLSGEARLSRRRLLQAGGLVAATSVASVVGLPKQMLSAANAKPTSPAGAGGLGPVTAVSRSTDLLDVFATGNDGYVYTAAWMPGDSGFRGWWRIGDLEVAPCSPIGAISRSRNKLDIFVAGLDGRVYAAAWEPGDDEFRSWWTVGDLITCPSAWITAVSRSTDKLDIFATDHNGRVHTAAWEPGDNGFRDWSPVSMMETTPGSHIGAVSRSADKMDLFATGLNGRIYSAAWEPGFDDWHGWWTIGDLTAKPGGAVTAVSRSADKLDIFTTDSNGRVHTAAWEPSFDDWHGWWTITTMETLPGSYIGAVSRSTDKMDLFATGLNGYIYSAAWDPGFDDWHGWSSIGDLTTQQGTAVTAVCRRTESLDVFVARNDARPANASWAPGSGWASWRNVASLVTGLTDPEIHAWVKVGSQFHVENTSYSVESQGTTTDGKNLYLVSNGDKTLRKFPMGRSDHQTFRLPVGSAQHVGAPGYYDGYVYVPVQRPDGVLKVAADLSGYTWYPIPTSGTERFPWCGVNPLNGRLYTTRSANDGIAYAFDRHTLEARPEDNIVLGTEQGTYDHLQGGCFTPRGRLLFAKSEPEGFLCFSARTGYCFGIRHASEYSELESVMVYPLMINNTEAQVHLYELDNDDPLEDDGYLYSYRVPEGKL